MTHSGGRRNFLKMAMAGTGMLASAAQEPPLSSEAAKPRRAADVRISSTPYAPVDYPIRPQPYDQVELGDTFWRPKVAANAGITIPFELRKFAKLDRALSGGVLEAGILSLRTHPDPFVQSQVEMRIQQLKERPGHRNSAFEIAATHYQVTGKRDLLDRAIADAAFLYEDFRLHSPRFSGGERDALNCVQLYRVTGDKKHLDMAKQYLDIRGLEDSLNRSRHNQSYKPVLEQSEAVGHAVNCVTLMVSLVDVGVLTGLQEYFEAGLRMWEDIAASKLYVTGGVGSTGNEGFGRPYSLPNISAYCETCAAMMFITLNHKLFLATGDGRYIDLMERTMYNNAVDGVSASADHFFYVNRLASAGDGRDVRWQHASLECCPPNLVRFFARMPGYIYAQDKKGAIYINLYVSGSTAFSAGGDRISLAVDSEMPWGGKSKITCTAGGADASLKLRIPGWARNQPVPGSLYSYRSDSGARTKIAVNGKEVSASSDRFGYVSLARAWRTGDTVEIEFPFDVKRVAADPRVREDRGRVAIERGPMVYCCEFPEAPGGHVFRLLFDRSAEFAPVWDKNFLGGAAVIQTSAADIDDLSSTTKPVRLIPYHLWANRGPGEMSVWLPAEEFQVGDIGPAGGFIFYQNPNYARDGWRYLEAAPFDQSSGAKWGCFRTAIPGASGTAVGSGRQNTEDMIAACPEPGSAAHLCAELSISGVRGWFLPSEDELDLMYRNLAAKGLGAFSISGPDNVNYWTSTQQSADMAGHIDFADSGRHHGDDKDFPRRVRAIRTL